MYTHFNATSSLKPEKDITELYPQELTKKAIYSLANADLDEIIDSLFVV